MLLKSYSKGEFVVKRHCRVKGHSKGSYLVKQYLKLNSLSNLIVECKLVKKVLSLPKVYVVSSVKYYGIVKDHFMGLNVAECKVIPGVNLRKRRVKA